MAQSPIQPYAAVHEHPNGPGDARPTALQIIKDEDLTMNWDKDNITILITGGSSGIGVETARALHHTGAKIFITTRDVSKAECVCDDILASSPSSKPIGIIEMDLDSLASVRRGAEKFLKEGGGRLNILINNAGVMAAPKGMTREGFETHIGVNHLAHFLLTKLLLPSLIASSSREFPSRVVNVASMGHWHQNGGIGAPGILEDLLYYEKGEYEPMLAYGRSKHANILHAVGIESRYGSKANPEKPIQAFSLHPGGITTELWRHMGGARVVDEHLSDHRSIWKNIEQGAATSVWCAVAAVWNGREGGRYCEDCGESWPSAYTSTETWVPGTSGYAPWAYDGVAGERLWSVSEEAVREFL